MIQNFKQLLIVFMCLLCYSCSNDKPLDNNEQNNAMDPPAVILPEAVAGLPGETATFISQIADKNGLKTITFICEPLNINETIDLKGSVAIVFEHQIAIPSDAPIGEEYQVSIIVRGNAKEFTGETTLFTNNVKDYDRLIFSYEDEKIELWESSLIKAVYPKVFKRTQAYNYEILIYSPAAGHKYRILGQNENCYDRLGCVSEEEKGHIFKGNDFAYFPEEGYLKVKLNLLKGIITYEKITPSVEFDINEDCYLFGAAIDQQWSQKPENRMTNVYENNPYWKEIKAIKIKTHKEPDLEFATASWKADFKPVGDGRSWEDMVLWGQVGVDKTSPIRADIEGGIYHVTFDFFLRQATFVKLPDDTEIPEIKPTPDPDPKPEIDHFLPTVPSQVCESEYTSMFLSDPQTESIWENSVFKYSQPMMMKKAGKGKFILKFYNHTANKGYNLYGGYGEENHINVPVVSNKYGKSFSDGRIELDGKTPISIIATGWLQIDIDLNSKSIAVSKLPQPEETPEPVYLVGDNDLIDSELNMWNTNPSMIMQPLYKGNPWIVFIKVNFKNDNTGSFLFTDKNWSHQIKPRKGCLCWYDVEWTDGTDGTDVTVLGLLKPRPSGGSYNIIFDQYLNTVVLVKE